MDDETLREKILMVNSIPEPGTVGDRFLRDAGRLHRHDHGNGVVALVDRNGRERVLMPQDLADQLEAEAALMRPLVFDGAVPAAYDEPAPGYLGVTAWRYTADPKKRAAAKRARAARRRNR
jgi:hypothetical protein